MGSRQRQPELRRLLPREQWELLKWERNESRIPKTIGKNINHKPKTVSAKILAFLENVCLWWLRHFLSRFEILESLMPPKFLPAFSKYAGIPVWHMAGAGRAEPSSGTCPDPGQRRQHVATVYYTREPPKFGREISEKFHGEQAKHPWKGKPTQIWTGRWGGNAISSLRCVNSGPPDSVAWGNPGLS